MPRLTRGRRLLRWRRGRALYPGQLRNALEARLGAGRALSGGELTPDAVQVQSDDAFGSGQFGINLFRGTAIMQNVIEQPLP